MLLVEVVPPTDRLGATARDPSDDTPQPQEALTTFVRRHAWTSGRLFFLEVQLRAAERELEETEVNIQAFIALRDDQVARVEALRSQIAREERRKEQLARDLGGRAPSAARELVCECRTSAVIGPRVVR